MEEQNKIVKYDAQINYLDFEGFKGYDMDLFMAICFKIGNKGTNRIELQYSDLLQLSRYRHVSIDEFHKMLKTPFRQKIFGLNFGLDSDELYEGWVLFDYYSANKKKQILTLEVSHKAEKFFNNVMKNFTLLDLTIYSRLQRKYSKFLYQHLCQFRDRKGSGWWIVSLDDLKFFLKTPEHYTNTEIKKEVLNPSVKELSPYMKISYETIKEKGKVRAYKFTFEESKKIKIPKKTIVSENQSEVVLKSIEEQHQEAIDEDLLMQKIKSVCGELSTRDCIAIIDDMAKHGRSEEETLKIVDFSKNQNVEN